MKGWTLTDVRGLPDRTYDEVVSWINDEVKAMKGDDEPSIDMDTVPVKEESTELG